MKSKLHFGILILLITFLVRYLENSVAPNQQIVVQFSNTEISENDTEKTIEVIKTKLHVVGVKQIQVGQNQDGHLKITYYSTTGVEEIQNILSDNETFKLTHGFADELSSKIPTEEKPESYKLDISEIYENSNTSDWGFDGVQVVEHNQKSDRFNNLKKSNSGYQNHSDFISVGVKRLISSTQKKLFLDNYSYIIPEVRAGPSS
ncbi:hypothetical protein [Winogradskyella sp.]|uniref:hypothetical protein n=1 Tax=Winogradskyella sp. TaxID=1883156 RepID=UPI00261DFF42|nr:hypothetical protein [Winogradskyella sp.]